MVKDNISFVQFPTVPIAVRNCNLCRIIINHEWSKTAQEVDRSSGIGILYGQD